MNDVTLLDGGMGTELRARGFEVPDHIRSIWSAKALIDAPEAIFEIHRDYIEAGADVITANNYMLTPPLLARAGLADRLEELTLHAVALALRARDASRRDVRIAGSLPPLRTRMLRTSSKQRIRSRSHSPSRSNAKFSMSKRTRLRSPDGSKRVRRWWEVAVRLGRPSSRGFAN